MLFVNKYSFTSFFAFSMSSISFSCLIAQVRTPSVVINLNGESEHLFFVPDLTGKYFPPKCKFYSCLLSAWQTSLLFLFDESFNWEWMLGLSKIFWHIFKWPCLFLFFFFWSSKLNSLIFSLLNKPCFSINTMHWAHSDLTQFHLHLCVCVFWTRSVRVTTTVSKGAE